MSHCKFLKKQQRIDELEKQLADTQAVLDRARADIRDYNTCIDCMIGGSSPCEWCEDWNECQLQAKGGKGCHQWWLRYRREEDEASAGESVFSTGAECGGETGGIASQIKAF